MSFSTSGDNSQHGTCLFRLLSTPHMDAWIESFMTPEYLSKQKEAWKSNSDQDSMCNMIRTAKEELARAQKRETPGPPASLTF